MYELGKKWNFSKGIGFAKKCWNEKIKLKRKINSCKVQLSLTSFYHCQFQLSTLQRGKKLIVEQLFIYFCVFFSSLWIQLFFGQMFIDYILFIPKVFLSMWKWHIILQWYKNIALIFLAKCVIWNITAQYQYFEFDKMVLKCSYLFIGYDSKWNWYRGYSTTNTKMFVSWFVFLLFLLWISKAFLILCKFFWLSFHFTKKKLFRHASVQITN